MTLLARVIERFDRLVPRDAAVLVAVSGGPDSLALLDLLHLGAPDHGRTLIVGHVDHGISAESARIAERVARRASELGLRFLATRLELGSGASETRARLGRRRALQAMAESVSANAIVLGHHADDQVETVLLRLLRGSGPAGLAGMAGRSGVWVRPLLSVPRADLVAHLAERGIGWWVDPANSDPRHLRSWLRSEILPRISSRLPDVTGKVLGAARQAAAARVAWDAVPGLLELLDLREDSGSISVAAPPLWRYRSEVRHAVLAALGRRFGVPIGARRLAAIERLASAGSGRVQVAARLEVELFDARLTLRRWHRASPAAIALEPGRLARVGLVDFEASERPAGETSREGWSTELPQGKYLARTWQQGDRIRPLHGRGNRAVSVLLREARVSSGRRPEWPVVVEVATATIVWVPGICRADAFIPEPGTKALHVECALA